MPKDAQILFTCTEAFKTALKEYAKANNVSAAIVIREAVARSIKYNLSEEELNDGRRKYKDEAERRAEQTKRQRKERAEVKKLIEVMAREDRLLNIAIIEESLRKKGINVE